MDMHRRTIPRPWLALISITLVAVLAHAGCGPVPGPGSADAGTSTVACGDRVCSQGEATTCVADCNPQTCGNNVCDPGDPIACPSDCESKCGDGVCQASESPSTCPGDCHVCGDGVCQSDETSASCPADCHVCGDGVCQSDESVSSCEADCAGTLVVQNASSKTVLNLYVAPCGATTWGNDQLGAHLIYPNGTFTLHQIPPGCYLFRAVASDSSYWERTSGTNIAAGGTFTWTLLNFAAIAGPPGVGPTKDASAGAIDHGVMQP
jgi:hypothetical protein